MSGQSEGLEPLDALPDGRRQIHLWGFMGAGKSTVAALVARRLVWNFLDLDALVRRHTGQSIPDIFASVGEKGFREAEAWALRQAVQKPRTVIALGGGAPVPAANRALTAPVAWSVWLRCDLETCLARLAGVGDRPLLTDPATAARLFGQRQSVYAEAEAVVDGSAAPEDIATEIVRLALGGGEAPS